MIVKLPEQKAYGNLKVIIIGCTITMTVELKANLWDFTGDIAPPSPKKSKGYLRSNLLLTKC